MLHGRDPTAPRFAGGNGAGVLAVLGDWVSASPPALSGTAITDVVTAVRTHTRRRSV
jgi:hypothetical protein